MMFLQTSMLSPLRIILPPLGGRPLRRAAREGTRATKRTRLGHAALRSAAQCTAESCVQGMVPWFFSPAVLLTHPHLGHDAVLTEFFHVVNGLEGHVRDWLLHTLA